MKKNILWIIVLKTRRTGRLNSVEGDQVEADTICFPRFCRKPAYEWGLPPQRVSLLQSCRQHLSPLSFLLDEGSPPPTFTCHLPPQRVSSSPRHSSRRHRQRRLLPRLQRHRLLLPRRLFSSPTPLLTITSIATFTCRRHCHLAGTSEILQS